MHKRGTTLVLKPLFEVALALFFVASVFSIAKGMGSQEYFTQAHIARDGALIVDALAGMEGNSWIKYPYDVSEYDIHLNRTVFWLSAQPSPIKHAFPATKGVIPRSVNDASAVVYKNGYNISLAEQPPLSFRFPCEYSDIGRFPSVKMNVAPGMEPVAAALALSCREGFCSRGETSAEDLFVKVVPLEREGTAANGLAARFYYDSSRLKESKEIACQFLNKFLERQPGLDVWLLPSDSAELAPRKSTPALLLEVGPNYVLDAAGALQTVVRVR